MSCLLQGDRRDPSFSAYRRKPVSTYPLQKRLKSGSRLSPGSATVLPLRGEIGLPLREEPVLGTRQAEVFAQGPALVLAAEQAAALQFGDDPVDELVEPTRDPWEHDVEPVAGVAVEPLLHLVGDGLRGADHRQAAIAA